MFVRSSEIPSPGQTSIDKTNDCAMKSERGALVSGSDPPSGHSFHKTTGEVVRVGQASDTSTFGRCCVENRRPKFSIPLRWQKIGPFSGLGEERRTPRATSRPLDHGRPDTSRPSSTFTGLARHERGWPRVDSTSTSKPYRRVNCF